MIILNEVMDVMRQIMHLYRQKREEIKRKARNKQGLKSEFQAGQFLE